MNGFLQYFENNKSVIYAPDGFETINEYILGELILHFDKILKPPAKLSSKIAYRLQISNLIYRTDGK